MNIENLVTILKNEVKPALGCTAPISVALAAARARKELIGKPRRIKVTLSPGIYKNGWGVCFPGGKGNALGAALGAIAGESELEMEVLANITPENIKFANNLVESGKVIVKFDPLQKGIFIEVSIEDGHQVVSAIIKDTHTKIVLVKVGERVIYSAPSKSEEYENIKFNEFSLKCLIESVEKIPLSKISFLLEGITMNRELAKAGLTGKYGHGIGKKLEGLVKSGVFSNDISIQARIITAAACDARMGGANLPAMSSAGSGNQGIIAILPLMLVAEKVTCSDEKLIRALAISHLINVMIKAHTGRISTTCSCAIAAGVGASAAITWMLNGDIQQISASIKNIVASFAGMICDGAKNGCALKIATSAQEAVISAYLSISGIEVNNYDGIIENRVEQTILNLGIVSKSANLEIDNVIVEIIMNKLTNGCLI